MAYESRAVPCRRRERGLGVERVERKPFGSADFLLFTGGAEYTVGGYIPGLCHR